MVLDSNLFTLTLTRRQKEPNILDLYPFTSSTQDENQFPLYTFSRSTSTNYYSVRLIDPLTEIVLCSIDCPALNDKIKDVQLHNPEEKVVLEKKGMTFRQDWRWTWQGNEFSIHKEGRNFILEAIRKPDPEIDIARYTASNHKSRPATLQLLDYNIQRLDIEDKRGLEIFLIAVTCHLLDLEYDETHKDGLNAGRIGGPNKAGDSLPNVTVNEVATEPNEILIDHHVPDSSYIEHSLNLLRQDDTGEGLHMIIIRANSSPLAQRAVRIAAEVKARWYKLPAIVKGRTLDPMPGNRCEIAEELYQYLRDPDLIEKQQQQERSSHDPTAGPRGRIKLDSPPSTAAVAAKEKRHSDIPNIPSRLDIYLSKDRIDEFERSISSSSNIPFINHSRPSTPASAKRPPPNIPPKTTAVAVNQDSSEIGIGAKRLLGKLGLRKSES